MSKIISSELTSISRGESLNKLVDLRDNCEEVTEKISLFVVNSKNRLKGRGYDALRKKLFLYSDAFNEQKIIFFNLYNSILDANFSLLNYMEGYEVIDDKDKKELEHLIGKIQRCIGYLESESHDEIMKNFNINENGISNYLAGLRGDLAKIKEYYSLVEGLGVADTKAASYLDVPNINALNFGNAVARINTMTFGNNYYDSIHLDALDIKTRLLIERAMIQWPDNMCQSRIDIINDVFDALSYKFTYNREERKSVVDAFSNASNGDEIPADCSSFVSFIYQKNGVKDEKGNLIGLWTTTNFNEHCCLYKSNLFTRYNLYKKDKNGRNIKITDNLEPGDLIMGFVSASGGANNHIGIYIGQDSDGKLICIDCASGRGKGNAVQISTVDKAFKFDPGNMYYIKYNTFK